MHTAKCFTAYFTDSSLFLFLKIGVLFFSFYSLVNHDIAKVDERGIHTHFILPLQPLLELVPENVPEYAEAYRLLKFLRYIRPIPETQIPPTSLLREFLGGSSFNY